MGDVRRDKAEKGGQVGAALEVSEGAGVASPPRCVRGSELRQADSSEHFAPAAFGLMLRWIDLSGQGSFSFVGSEVRAPGLQGRCRLSKAKLQSAWAAVPEQEPRA